MFLSYLLYIVVLHMVLYINIMLIIPLNLLTKLALVGIIISLIKSMGFLNVGVLACI